MTGLDLREIRQRFGESQETFSRRIGVTRNTIHVWEIGRYPIPQPVAFLLEYLKATAPEPVEA